MTGAVGVIREGREVVGVSSLRADRATAASAVEPLRVSSKAGVPDARRLLRERARRGRLFPHIGETGWLILLDLYVNQGRDICVSSACLASFGPPTTALRHIEVMERDGLVHRTAAPFDRRKFYLSLTDTALAKLCAFFAEGEA